MELRFPTKGADERAEVQRLLANVKGALPELRELLSQCGSEWGYEDPVYRLYHQSFKVYGLQATTERIVEALAGLAPEPGKELNAWFVEIVREGTGKTFEMEHNARWLEMTRPIVEAFFHARFFLEMAVRYGEELEEAPRMLPSGWAAFLYLFDLR